MTSFFSHLRLFVCFLVISNWLMLLLVIFSWLLPFPEPQSAEAFVISYHMKLKWKGNWEKFTSAMMKGHTPIYIWVHRGALQYAINCAFMYVCVCTVSICVCVCIGVRGFRLSDSCLLWARRKERASVLQSHHRWIKYDEHSVVFHCCADATYTAHISKATA